MKRCTLVLLALLSGCSGTGSSPIGGGVEPSGWIYFAPYNDPLKRAWRINIGNSEVQQVRFPLPYDTTRPWSVEGEEVSPTTGEITGLAFVGGSAPENFVYFPVGDSIRVIRFAPASQFSISVGFQLIWAPDGRKILFELNQINCCEVLALFYPSTGVVDTLVGPNAVTNRFFWLGQDTVITRDRTRPKWPYMSVDVATGETAPWNDVKAGGIATPTSSANRQWVAHFPLSDSTTGGGEVKSFWSLHLLDRTTGFDTTLVVDHADSDGRIFPGASFDPSSRFIAYCTSNTEISILRLDDHQVIKSFEVQMCARIRWSWGEGGNGQ